MAPPTATETETATTKILSSLSLNAVGKVQDVEPEKPVLREQGRIEPEENYRFSHLLPTFDSSEKYPPLQPFVHADPGLKALLHPNPRAFLEGAKTTQLTPAVGLEIDGIDLLKLTQDQKDELALAVAQHKVVVLRNQQDWFNSTPEEWKEWASYYGRLHIHPTSGHPEGHPQLHLVYRAKSSVYNYERQNYLTTATWHSDVSYEFQPPGLTTFFLLDIPSTGGDTMFISQVAVLKKFSPTFVAFLRTLKAVHSAVSQAEHSRTGKRSGVSVVRREPVENEHPIVRKHPVTGEEALYVNSQFTTRIVGLKKEESDNLLNFLNDAVAKAHDAQLRVKWVPNTVVIWDNRVTSHSAIVDYSEGGERRHGARLAAQAENPIPALQL